MGSVVIVLLYEVIELVLLLKKAKARRLGCLLLQRQVHPLMPAVLLWIARLNAFDIDSKA